MILPLSTALEVERKYRLLFLFKVSFIVVILVLWFRLLQLVSTDDVNADPLNVLQLKQTQQKMARKLQTAKNWVNNPNAPAGT